MKKIGSLLLLILGGILLIYGVILAPSNGVLYYLIIDLSAIWAIAMCTFNIIAPGLKKKKWINIVTVVVFINLIVNAAVELSNISNVPHYMQGRELAIYKILFLNCPGVFVLVGAALLVLGGRVLGSTRKRAI